MSLKRQTKGTCLSPQFKSGMRIYHLQNFNLSFKELSKFDAGFPLLDATGLNINVLLLIVNLQM